VESAGLMGAGIFVAREGGNAASQDQTPGNRVPQTESVDVPSAIAEPPVATFADPSVATDELPPEPVVAAARANESGWQTQPQQQHQQGPIGEAGGGQRGQTLVQKLRPPVIVGSVNGNPHICAMPALGSERAMQMELRGVVVQVRANVFAVECLLRFPLGTKQRLCTDNLNASSVGKFRVSGVSD